MGRKLTPLHPTKGAAVIFSSGWENMHQVDKLTSGTRLAVPCFFTTEPVPEMSIDLEKEAARLRAILDENDNVNTVSYTHLTQPTKA